MKMFKNITSGQRGPLTFSLCFAISFIVTIGLTAGVVNGAQIVAFGDSITSGKGSSSGGYPPKLASILNSNGKPSTVINKGSSGEITPGGVGRIGGVLSTYQPNIVLIMEGTNDVRSGISVETTRANLQSMIDQSIAAGAIAVIATLTPSNINGSETLIPEVWNPMIKGLSASALSDQYAAILPTWGSSNVDGIHPNDVGYTTIANTWYGTIGGMIGSDGAVSSSGGGGGGGPCFIATAAFGSPIEKNVRLLKDFRDKFLLTNFAGQQFVKFYYTHSPPIADFIAESEGLKAIVRVFLYPLIAISYLLLNAPIFLLACILFGGWGLVRFKKNRRVA